MYDDFFGLKERPFQLTPDAAFYYESVSHKKALSYLGYGLQQGEGFIVITGEVGAGKSTLVAHLRSRLDWNSVTIGEVVTSAVNGSDMIALTAHSFGLDVQEGNKAAALGAIEAFLQDEARAGRKVVLVVDEAQNLTIGALEELRMLSNFHLGSQPLLQMLLLGQPEFRQLISEWDELEQLRQRIIASHHLEGMQPDEIKPYVHHRMHHAGWTGQPVLKEGIWPLIYEETRGIPRLVNRFMSRALMRAAMEERIVIDKQLALRIIDELQGRVMPDFPLTELSSHDMPEEPEPTIANSRGEFLDDRVKAIEQVLHARDKEIAALKDRIAQVKAGTDADDLHDLHERMARLEAKLEDQERTLRQTLSMMINFYETSARRDAA